MELVFVIVLLGIFAALALPKFAQSLNQADLTNLKSKVSAIRSGIEVYKNKHILLGEDPLPDTLDSDSTHLFGKVLSRSVTPCSDRGCWMKSNGVYRYYFADGKYIAFTYDSDTGEFACDSDKSTIDDAETICDNF